MTESGEQAKDEWTSRGIPLRGWRDYIIAAGALAYHVLSLRWLRAPRWKNKAEARAELARLAAELALFEHEYWADKIGRTKRIEFTTDQGTWYQGSIEPVWDDEPGGTIRVLISVDDGGVGAYWPLTDCLLVESRGAAARVLPERAS